MNKLIECGLSLYPGIKLMNLYYDANMWLVFDN